MGDAPVEPVHLVDDGAQLLPRRRRVRALEHELRGGAETRERIPEAVRDGGRHLADRGELFRLDQLGLGLAESPGHVGEGAGQVADLVLALRGDRVLQLAGAHHAPSHLEAR